MDIKALLELFAKPIMEAKSSQMTNPRYTVLVMPHLYGQYRIQLTDLANPDKEALPGHGSIIVEC